MMGYDDGGGEFSSMTDSFNGRKLRPLFPRPPPTNNTAHPQCVTHVHRTDLVAINHHLASVAEQSKRELNSTQHVVVSSRWNPTPEQLQILEDLYGRGTRTPSTDQIQHITATLRRYGKIEGKNVFYWFQNHKARERQKRRRQLLESTTSDDLLPLPDQLLEDPLVDNRKESEANKTGFEVEQQTKSCVPPTNCSALAERGVSMQKAAKAGAGRGGPECRAAAGWEQFEERGGDLLLLQQQRKGLAERNATWNQMMQLSSPTNLTNYTTATTSRITTSTTAAIPSSSTITTPMESKLMKGQGFNIFRTRPHIDEYSDLHHLLSFCDRASIADEKSKTLQLFPLRGNEDSGSVPKETHQIPTTAWTITNNNNSNDATPSQYFEFLPLKN